jgi:hypothetical protein
MFTKATNSKLAARPQIPVFPKTIGPRQPTPEKRDNLFFKSRDQKEDQGTR